ncbi:MAG: hypothetical protein ACOY9Y_10755 [Bacillota bacterium]
MLQEQQLKELEATIMRHATEWAKTKHSGMFAEWLDGIVTGLIFAYDIAGGDRETISEFYALLGRCEDAD